MIQAEYVNSFNHNYLKVKSPMTKERKLRYQYRILTTRKLEGLLPVSMHIADGECGLYYEISSKQSLPKWLLKEKIGRVWMDKLILNLKTVLWSMEQYLLDSRNMILDPQYIFQDMESEKISFLYIPYCVEKEKNDIGVFLTFLVENADTQEEDTITLLYDIYSKWESMQERFTIETFLSLWTLGRDKMSSVPVAEDIATPIEDLPEEEKEDIYVKKRDFGEFIFGRTRKTKVAESVDGDSEVAKESYIYKESGFAEDTGERTTYMEIKPEELEKKLYGNGKENRKVISLEKLPIVVGKKGEKADVTLADASVSRMHARLTEENGQLYLEDLNATNGTFKNGVRLKPYERVEIDKEDEVKFGKLSFTYR